MTEVSVCPGCGQPNQCTVSRGTPVESCWCMKPEQVEGGEGGTPILFPIPKETVSCYCEPCLEKVKKELARAQRLTG